MLLKSWLKLFESNGMNFKIVLKTSKSPSQTFRHLVETKQQFPRNSTTSYILLVGGKSALQGIYSVKLYPRKTSQRGRFSNVPFEEKLIEGYIDGHNIDFIKGKVAFDLEWNSKDQTFDRDLLAMRTYFDCGLIEVGIIVTRSEELNDIFKELKDTKGKPLMPKYGASTTWMGKLEYRLKSRRNGGCPILAIGIKKPCVEGYE